MAARVTTVWTKNIASAKLSFDESYGFSEISFMLISGAATFLGSGIANAVTSDAIALQVGIPITIGANSGYPLVGVIDATSGTVQIIAKQ